MKTSSRVTIVLACVLIAGVVGVQGESVRGAAVARRLSTCDEIGGDSAQFLCGLANAVWSDLFPASDLLKCVESGVVTIEDFYEAAEKLTDAFDAWRHGNHTGAIRIAEEALGSIKEGLGEFHEMLEGCREMEKLAERIGGVVAKLENVLGETLEVVEVLTKAVNVYDLAVNLKDNWGNWVQCGEDAANLICDASQIWGDGC